GFARRWTPSSKKSSSMPRNLRCAAIDFCCSLGYAKPCLRSQTSRRSRASAALFPHPFTGEVVERSETGGGIARRRSSVSQVCARNAQSDDRVRGHPVDLSAQTGRAWFQVSSATPHRRLHRRLRVHPSEVGRRG